MKKGDIIIYVGTTDWKYTKNKKYIIEKVEIDTWDYDNKYFIFIMDDMNSLIWFEDKILHNMNFKTLKEHRKEKLEEIKQIK